MADRDSMIEHLISEAQQGDTRKKEIVADRLNARLTKAERDVRQWRDAWAAAHVDADRREQRAMKRAESCEAHGKDIIQLEESVGYFSARADEYEAQRNALLGLLWSLRDFANGEKETATLERGKVAEFVKSLEREYEKASKTFDKRWKALREETERKRNKELFRETEQGEDNT